MAVSTEVWLPIATFVLGGLMTQVAEAVREHRRYRREETLRDKEIRAQSEHRRAEGRRSDLMTLKKELSTLLKSVRNYPEEPSFGWMNTISESEINAVILSEAIGDPDINQRVRKILDYVGVVSGDSECDQAFINKTWSDLDENYEEVSIALGRLLRQAA